MDDSLYKLIFQGETLRGFRERQVRKNLTGLLNADKESLTLLFSGKPIIIRKNLSASEIRPYERAMMKAGARCRILSMNGDETLPATPLEIIHEQEQEQHQTASPCKASRKFQLFPRMGRVEFMASLWMVALPVIFAGRLTPHLSAYHPFFESPHLIPGLIAIASLFLLTMAARRLHDMNLSGQKSFFFVIPGVNLLFLVWLIFAAGTQDTNRFGSPPNSAGTVAQIFGLWIPLLTLIASGTYGWLHQDELQQLVAYLPQMIDHLDISLPEQNN